MVMTETADIRKIHIVFDGQETPPLKIHQLFDSQKYDQLIAVTGEITADFINKYLSKFISIDVALSSHSTSELSADEMVTKVALTNALLSSANKEAAKLFSALTSDNQTNVLNNLFRVSIAPTQVIHSKFYLLSNSTTHDTRVILVSVVLDEASFDAHRNQFEEGLELKM